jgi:hypothetical protein
LTRPNGHSDNGNAGLMQEPAENHALDNMHSPPLAPAPLPEFATRAKQRARQQIQQNRFVIIGAGAIVMALLIFVAISVPHRGGTEKAKNRGAISKDESTVETSNESNEKSLFPIIDSGRPATKETHQGFLNERDLQRTVIRSGTNIAQVGQPNRAEALGSIPPFVDKWQVPPYEAGSSADATDVSKAEREAMEKPSLMYVSKISSRPPGPPTANEATAELGLGLATGTRLRARLDSAASTAVRAPVLAVIEYNYEQGGELLFLQGQRQLVISGKQTVQGTLTFNSILY